MRVSDSASQPHPTRRFEASQVWVGQNISGQREPDTRIEARAVGTIGVAVLDGGDDVPTAPRCAGNYPAK